MKRKKAWEAYLTRRELLFSVLAPASSTGMKSPISRAIWRLLRIIWIIVASGISPSIVVGKKQQQKNKCEREIRIYDS